MFSRPSLVIYSFATPPITLKLGQQIGRRLLVGDHLDQSLWRANQKLWSSVRSYSLRSFLQVLSIAASFTSHRNLCNCAEPKLYSWAKPPYFDFSSSNFSVQHTEHLWRCTIAIVLGWLPRFYSPSLEMHYCHSISLVATVLQPSFHFVVSSALQGRDILMHAETWQSLEFLPSRVMGSSLKKHVLHRSRINLAFTMPTTMCF